MTQLTLDSNTIFLSPLGNYSLWGSDDRPTFFEETNATYISHPQTIEPPPFPETLEHVFNGSVEADALMEWLKEGVPEVRAPAATQRLYLCSRFTRTCGNAVTVSHDCPRPAATR